MQIITTQRYIRMSPKKIRPVARVAAGMTPEKAIEILPYMHKRSAEPLVKAIKTALANAKDQGVQGDLVFKEIQIGEGPMLKRGRAASKGRWHQYKRRMSHIRVVLKEVPVEKKTKKETSAKVVDEKDMKPKSTVSKLKNRLTGKESSKKKK